MDTVMCIGTYLPSTTLQVPTMNLVMFFGFVPALLVQGEHQLKSYDLKEEMQETLDKLESILDDVTALRELKPTLEEFLKGQQYSDEYKKVNLADGVQVLVEKNVLKNGRKVQIVVTRIKNKHHEKSMSIISRMEDTIPNLLDKVETDAEIFYKLVEIRIELMRATEILPSLKQHFGDDEEVIYFDKRYKILDESVKEFKQTSDKSKSCFTWKKALVIAGGGAITAAALVAALSAIIAFLGFTPVGIAGGSIAAWMMSIGAGGGLFASLVAGLVSVLQSIGAAGLGLKLLALVGGAGLAGGSAMTAMMMELTDWLYSGC